MMYRLFLKCLIIIVFGSAFLSCKPSLVRKSNLQVLADKEAAPATKYLMMRIKEIPKSGYAFGHQDAMAYGMGWKNDGSSIKSDVHDVTGDFPGVYGFELGHLELGYSQNLDTVNFKLMKRLIKKAHAKRGIITLSWHPDNPVTKNSAWDPSPAVSDVLEGGVLHPKYMGWLSNIAEFMNSLKTKSGDPSPVVFRPYHEMNGSWFWWGHGNCTPEEFKKLWTETFEFLTQKHHVHNLLYCYSTDAVKDKEEYLRYYPGDEYVDILGIDLYHKNSAVEYIELLNNNLGLLSEIAGQKNKPYAMTEGGLNMIPIDNWWTQILDKNVADKGVSWALFWRNAWPNHYFAPFKGQKSAMDFKKFKEQPHVLFLNIN